MKRFAIILLIVCLMLVFCCCTDNNSDLGKNSTSGTTDSASGDETITTSPVEEGTESPNPENDQHWTDNY